MKTFFTLLVLFSFQAGAQDFKGFNQALVENLSHDLRDISHFVKKEQDKKHGRSPAATKIEMSKLRVTAVSIHDVSRYQTNKTDFVKSKQATYDIDQIRNFQNTNYMVVGGNNF